MSVFLFVASEFKGLGGEPFTYRRAGSHSESWPGSGDRRALGAETRLGGECPRGRYMPTVQIPDTATVLLVLVSEGYD